MQDPFSKDRILKTDRKRVYDAYSGWPALAREGFRVDVKVPRPAPRKAYFLGMGGSAAGGDIVASWLTGRRGVEIAVFKGQMPIGDMSDALAVACSVSGQTEETIKMMQTAVARGATVISMSTGGRLAQVSDKLGVPRVAVPKVLAPRFSLPFIVFAALSILDRTFGLRCGSEADETFRQMDALADKVSGETPVDANPSKALALRLMGVTPVIYGSRVTRGAGIRFKNVLNENAKKHALFDGIPDAFHNDVESWADPTTGFIPIFLRHSAEEAGDRSKTDALLKLLTKAGKGPVEVRGSGRSSLSQILSMVYELDMVSYYIAIGLGRDPFPVALIDSLKSA